MKRLFFLVPIFLTGILLLAACSTTKSNGPDLTMQADIVRGHAAPLGPVCSDVSQLAQGEMAVSRVKVFDPASGKELTDAELKSVTLNLGDGQSFPMAYGGHGGNTDQNIPPTDYFWTAGWEIPTDYPTGTVKWWVTAEAKDGRSGRYEPLNMAASMLTIIERAVSPLIVQADIVRGHTAPLGPVCSEVSQLAPGEMAVTRVKVLDPATGQELTDDDIDSVTWSLGDGQSFPMAYGGHGGNTDENIPPTDYFWTAGWEVPADYPTGTVKWWVTAEGKDGRSGRYDPINMAASMLTIIEPPSQ